jgi:hypothetical protein
MRVRFLALLLPWLSLLPSEHRLLLSYYYFELLLQLLLSEIFKISCIGGVWTEFLFFFFRDCTALIILLLHTGLIVMDLRAHIC